MLKIFQKKTRHGWTKIHKSDELLKQHKNLVALIYHESRAPQNQFDSYYMFSIKKMAILVQSLPASQTHHHSFAGGFLLHNLEVIHFALRKRNTMQLPSGASVEVQSQKKDVWSFVIFAASIMHDIGKIVSDINVTVFDKKYQVIGRWSPFTGSILNNKDSKYYQYTYNTNRKYQHHTLCANILLTELIHPVALDWLKKNDDAWHMLLMAINGRSSEAGVIGEIIKYADSLSSSNSIKTMNNVVQQQSVESANNAPLSLADKLLAGFKYLCLESDIKVNQLGGPIWTTETDIYFVSKKSLDLIKAQGIKDGQTGIPHDNSRLMDELLQFNIIIPNDDKAIWGVELQGGGLKSNLKLTMLRMSIDKIFTEENKPKPFAGDIVITDSGEVVNTTTQKTTPKNSPTPDNNTQDLEKTTKEGKKELGQLVETRTSQENIKKTTVLLPPGITPPNDNSNVNDKKDQTNNQQEESNIELETTLGESFFAWLKDSISNDNIEYNNAEAKLHIVEYANSKALFLVSPRIFKEFDKDNWANVQKQFTRTKFNEKSFNDENIWKVETTTNRKGKEPSIIKGYLISNLDGFDNIPDVNARIRLITR